MVNKLVAYVFVFLIASSYANAAVTREDFQKLMSSVTTAEDVVNLVTTSMIAVSVCNEKELPNIDFRGSPGVLLGLAMRYEHIVANMDVFRLQGIEKKFSSKSKEEKYKFCMGLYQKIPELFEDREGGK